MKERESELTIRVNSPKLEHIGNIFMSEQGEGEQEANKPKTEITGKQTISEVQWGARQALRELTKPSEHASIDEKGAYELARKVLMERAGISPITGAADADNSPGLSFGAISDELRDYILKSREGASIGITRNLRRILKENGVPAGQIKYFADHPEEFRQSLDGMLARSDKIKEVQSELMAVYEVEPKPLTQDALSFLDSFNAATDEEKLKIKITPEIENTLFENGISKELIDKYKTTDPVVLVAGLVQRKISFEEQRDERPGEIPPREEEEGKSVLLQTDAGRGKRGVNEPLSPPIDEPDDSESDRHQPRQTREILEDIDKNTESVAVSTANIKEEMKKLIDSFGLDETGSNVLEEAMTQIKDKEGNVSGNTLQQIVSSRREGMVRASQLTKEVKEHVSVFLKAREKGEEGLELAHSAREKFIEDVSRIDLEGVISEDVKKRLNFKELFDTVKNSGDMDKITDALKALAPHIIDYHKNMEEQIPSIPESLEDLARLAMSKDPEFRTGEPLELMDFEGKLNKKNFINWMRHKMWDVHNFNPTSEVSFFSDEGMGIKTDYRVISFFEIAFTRSFFLEREKIDDEREITVKNKDYEKLRTQMIQEVFLFQLARNGAVLYDQHNRQGEDMSKTVESIFKTNPLTRGEFFEFIFTMSSMNRKSLGEIVNIKDTINLKAEGRNEDSEIRHKLENNFLMGDAIRIALGAYENSFSYEQMTKFLGKNAPMFKREHQIEEEGEVFTRGITPDPKGRVKRSEWFYSEDDTDVKNKKAKAGDLKTSQRQLVINSKGGFENNFMYYINIFSSPQIEQERIKDVRLRMVASIKDKTGVSYAEAQIAEAWAYSLVQLMGISAQLDIEATTHNYWARVIHTRDKRERERQPSRRGKYGRKNTLKDIKRLGLTFMEGATDNSGRSIKEIIQGGQGSDVDLELSPIKTRLDYERFKEGENKGYIIFRDKKNTAKNLRIRDYLLDEDGNVNFHDDEGNIVNTEGLMPQEAEIKAKAAITFDSDTQRQFHANHLLCAVKVNEFVINAVEMGFPEMVTGFDSRGNPIIKVEKVNEIKDGIQHDIRYKDSTWGVINYQAEIVTPVKEYDEDGKTTSIKIKKVTVLEDMFGPEILGYIRDNLKRLDAWTDTQGENHKYIDGFGWFDFSAAGESKFKEAVWLGEFDYYVAKEIEAHRDWGSGYRRYTSMDMLKTTDALRLGEFASPEEIKNIKEKTKTEARRLFMQDLGWAFFTGSFEGFFAMIKLLSTRPIVT